MHVNQNYSQDMMLPSGPGIRQPAWWNVISICIPFLGLLFALCLLCALASSDALAHMLGVGHPAAVAVAALFFWLGFGVLGLVAAVIALVRAERLWGITLVSFLLNGSLALVFLLSDGGWAESLVFRMKFGFLAGAALLFVGFWTRRKKSPTTPT
jgi:hypothetical protein